MLKTCRAGNNVVENVLVSHAAECCVIVQVLTLTGSFHQITGKQSLDSTMAPLLGHIIVLAMRFECFFSARVFIFTAWPHCRAWNYLTFTGKVLHIAYAECGFYLLSISFQLEKIKPSAYISDWHARVYISVISICVSLI